MRSSTTIAAVALGAFLAPAGVEAAEDHKARAWAASCAACHGTNGRSESEVPKLAGKSKADLFDTLKEFKAGKRSTATVMHQHAKGYTDEQLERIADYFSRQAR